MVLRAQPLNPESTLNNIDFKSEFRFFGGEDVTFLFQIVQEDKNDLRYIIPAGSNVTLNLLKSDESELNLSGSFRFVDDRSIVEFTLPAADSTNVISQNIFISIVEDPTGTPKQSFAFKSSGITRQVIREGCS